MFAALHYIATDLACVAGINARYMWFGTRKGLVFPKIAPIILKYPQCQKIPKKYASIYSTGLVGVMGAEVREEGKRRTCTVECKKRLPFCISGMIVVWFHWNHTSFVRLHKKWRFPLRHCFRFGTCFTTFVACAGSLTSCMCECWLLSSHVYVWDTYELCLQH